MLNVCLNILYSYICSFDRISYLNVFILRFELFSFESYSAWICAFCIDFCMFFYLNVIVHGFVHFARIFAFSKLVCMDLFILHGFCVFFHLNVVFKIN